MLEQENLSLIFPIQLLLKSFRFSKSAASQLLGYFSFKPELGPGVGGHRWLRDISSFQIKSNIKFITFVHVNTSARDFVPEIECAKNIMFLPFNRFNRLSDNFYLVALS